MLFFGEKRYNLSPGKAKNKGQKKILKNKKQDSRILETCNCNRPFFKRIEAAVRFAGQS
jgi:hypothetical protein